MNAILISYPPTTHRYDFAVTLTVIAILATLLLGSLNQAQNEIEKLQRDSLRKLWVQSTVKCQEQ